MQAEYNPEFSDKDISKMLEAKHQFGQKLYDALSGKKIPYNEEIMLEALKENMIASVKVATLKPGDIVTVDGKQMKVVRINSENGEPILEPCS